MATPEESSRGSTRLLIHSPGQKPVDFQLGSATLPCSIGRSGSNCIVLPFPAISRRHASLAFREGGFWIEDLRSSNGTLVNGVLLREPRRMEPGDQVEIGPCVLHFEPAGERRFDYAEEGAGPLTIHSLSMEDILKADSKDTERRSASQELGVVQRLDVMTKALLAHYPLAELYERVVSLVAESLSPDRAVLFLRERDRDELVPQAAYDRSGAVRNEILVSRSIARQALEERRSVLVRDAMADPQFQAQDSVILQQIRSALCVPLWNEEEVIGILYTDKRSPLERFGEDDLRLLTLVGHLAAVKIRETEALEELQEHRRMKEELQRAAGIQRQLLPSEPLGCPDYVIAGSNLPSLDVGGDYFDYWSLEDGGLFFGLGDVSGKGMSAALLMASLHTTVRAFTESGLDLAQVAARVNVTIHRQVDGQRFITLFLGKLDCSRRRLTFVNAGHNPPLLLRSDGSLETLSTGGLLLGIFPEAEFDVGEVEIGEGDLLLVYSDGVTEAQHPEDEDEEYGTERLESLIRAHVALDPEALVRRVMTEAQEFSHPLPQGDDITVLVLKRQ